MLIRRDPEHLPAVYGKTALAIGNFDGFHLGHQAVIRTMLERAREKEMVPAVLTFEPHPKVFFNHRAEPLRIEPFHRKARRLREAGVEFLLVARFNEALAGKTAETFVEEILIRHLRVGELITGENFRFGRDRGGDSAFLKEKSRKGYFGYMAVPSVAARGIICSSTALRQALGQGDMPQAAVLLGRPYETEGRVAHGDGRGKHLGAATANLRPGVVFQPRRGVYAVRFKAREEKEWREGVANFGIRPTFGGTAPLLEIHGLNMEEDLYGRQLTVQWMEFIREEIAFSSAEALKIQIADDIARTKQFFLRDAS